MFQFCSCSPQHKNALLGQPWSRELSLGQSSDCHYLQEKKKSLVSLQVAPQGILVGVGSRRGWIQHRAKPLWFSGCWWVKDKDCTQCSASLGCPKSLGSCSKVGTSWAL